MASSSIPQAGPAARPKSRNGPARASVLVGLVGVAALPAAVAVAELGERIDLFQAAVSVPVAFLLGLLAIWLGRRGRRRFERTVGRVGGAGVARLGRWLGLLAVCLALAGATAVGFYELLIRYYE
jgi:drug/metabolite transporter (DMT)-like permease